MMLLFVFDRRANRVHRPSGEIEILSFTACTARLRACTFPDLRSSRRSVADTEEVTRFRKNCVALPSDHQLEQVLHSHQGVGRSPLWQLWPNRKSLTLPFEPNEETSFVRSTQPAEIKPCVVGAHIGIDE